MLKELIITKLESLNKPIKQTGKNYIMTTCLSSTHNEKHPSFTINLETGNGFCFACGYKVNKNFWIDGKIDEELERKIKYQQLKNRLTTTKLSDNIYDTKTNIILPFKSGSIEFLCDKNKRYRGIHLDTYNELDIYYCDKGFYKERIVFPIYYNVELIAFETRSINNTKKQKYIHSKGFNNKEILYPYKSIKNGYAILVEGIFDAISLYEMGLSVICNWGVSLNYNENKIKELIKLGVETIYLTFDKDEAGVKATNQFLNSNLKDYFDIKLGTEKKELKDFYKSNCKDINEWYQKSNLFY